MMDKFDFSKPVTTTLIFEESDEEEYSREEDLKNSQRKTNVIEKKTSKVQETDLSPVSCKNYPNDTPDDKENISLKRKAVVNSSNENKDFKNVILCCLRKIKKENTQADLQSDNHLSLVLSDKLKSTTNNENFNISTIESESEKLSNIYKELMSSLSENLITILKIIQRENSEINKNLNIEWLNNYVNKMKNHYFSLSYPTVITIFTPLKNDLDIVEEFIHTTIDIAKNKNIACAYEDIKPLLLDLINWVEIKKLQTQENIDLFHKYNPQSEKEISSEIECNSNEILLTYYLPDKGPITLKYPCPGQADDLDNNSNSVIDNKTRKANKKRNLDSKSNSRPDEQVTDQTQRSHDSNIINSNVNSTNVTASVLSCYFTQSSVKPQTQNQCNQSGFPNFIPNSTQNSLTPRSNTRLPHQMITLQSPLYAQYVPSNAEFTANSSQHAVNNLQYPANLPLYKGSSSQSTARDTACNSQDADGSAQYRCTKSQYPIRSAQYAVGSAYAIASRPQYPANSAHGTTSIAQYPANRAHGTTSRPQYPTSSTHGTESRILYPASCSYGIASRPQYPTSSAHGTESRIQYPASSSYGIASRPQYLPSSAHGTTSRLQYPASSAHGTDSRPHCPASSARETISRTQCTAGNSLYAANSARYTSDILNTLLEQSYNTQQKLSLQSNPVDNPVDEQVLPYVQAPGVSNVTPALSWIQSTNNLAPDSTNSLGNDCTGPDNVQKSNNPPPYPQVTVHNKQKEAYFTNQVDQFNKQPSTSYLKSDNGQTLQEQSMNLQEKWLDIQECFARSSNTYTQTGHSESLQAETMFDKQEARKSLSRDSGFMSPTYFNCKNNELQNTSEKVVNSSERMPVVTHVTSLNQSAVLLNNGKCLVCGTVTKYKCKRCYLNYYCSLKCQAYDWKQHEPVCTKLANAKNQFNK